MDGKGAIRYACRGACHAKCVVIIGDLSDAENTYVWPTDSVRLLQIVQLVTVGFLVPGTAE